ncbi:MAG TPA: suppressor of fused domain protein [Longimicrobium sp.]|nr:suppressor of fused domain protein [Longimicrobium sp.]
MRDDEPELSGSGAPIYRHQAPPEGDEPLAEGDLGLIQAISDHVERHVGPVEQVFHEIVSPTIHVDIHWVAPSRERPWHTLVTSGMSERPMNVPPEATEWAYAELMVALPASWPLTMEAFDDEANYWPLRWLKILARFPHEYQTWLGFGHTIPNGDPPEPFAPSTRLSGMMLVPPLRYPEEFWRLDLAPEKKINFWCLLPLYAEEMDLKLRKGADALIDLFEQADVNEVLNPSRPNVAATRRWWRFR